MNATEEVDTAGETAAVDTDTPQWVMRLWFAHPSDMDIIELRIVRYDINRPEGREGWGQYLDSQGNGQYLDSQGNWVSFPPFAILPATLTVERITLRDIGATLDFDQLQAAADVLTNLVTAKVNAAWADEAMEVNR